MKGFGQLYFAMDLSALIVCITALLFTIIHHRTEKAQNKVFISAIFVISLNSICGMVTTLLEPYRFDSDTVLKAVNASRYIYFIFHTALAPIFFYYVACVCGAVSNIGKPQNLFYSSIFIITEIAVLLNPVTHWIYHYDKETLVYTRDWAESAIYIAAAVYFSLAAMMLMFSWDALTRRRKIALIYFFAIIIAGVMIQLFYVEIRTELFAEALALLGIMISIESEEDRMDPDTGVYNRKALENDLEAYFLNKRILRLVCVKITGNETFFERTVGGDRYNVSGAVASFLRKLLPRYCIYAASPTVFMLTLFDFTETETEDLTLRIIQRFDKPWSFGDKTAVLSATVMSAEIPLRVAGTSEALYMADSPVPKHIEKKILTGSDLDYLLRRATIEKAVSRGLKEHTFEVYYQPTYCLEGHRLHGAEALLRLHDTVIGHVYPGEFIPVAESLGLIDALDDFVLGEVCDFLKSGIPQKYGMENINVNLSVIQFMQPGFVERINDIVESAGVDKKLINFEITESVGAEDYRLLARTISALRREGFLFSMDDYGTGYSNMQSLFSIGFDVVKIDKSILWSAEQGRLGRIILENSIRMIKQMGKKVLVEGVETQSQLDMLTEFGVDYLQGYFFSRPIPKDAFIELISK